MNRSRFFTGLAAAPTANQSGLASLNAQTRGSIRRRCQHRTCAERSSLSISGHTPASTGCARSPTSAPGRRSTRTRDWCVIGVHTPEFRFEKNIDNVRREVKALRVDYPVAVDSEYVIWRAFNNNYWPAQYFIDAQGRVRHTHFGEGSYDQSEMVIQRLLMEAGADGIGDSLVTVEQRGFEVAADWANLKSPENYVGYERTEGFASPGGAVRDKSAHV